MHGYRLPASRWLTRTRGGSKEPDSPRRRHGTSSVKDIRPIQGLQRYRSSVPSCTPKSKCVHTVRSLFQRDSYRPTLQQQRAVFLCRPRHGGEAGRSAAGARLRPGRVGRRDAVQGRRAERVERAGRRLRVLQHLGGAAPVPDRRPAAVRVPQGDGLGAPGGRGRLQRLQHLVLRRQVRRRQHRVHVRPLGPLLLRQRQRGQLPRQREAHRRRPRRPLRHPHPAGSAADVSCAAAEPALLTSFGCPCTCDEPVVVIATPFERCSRAGSCGHPDVAAVPGGFGSGARSHHHPELAAGARCPDPVAVHDTNTRRRVLPATVCFRQRAGRRGRQLHHAASAFRSCPRGRGLRRLVRRLHRLRHACSLR